MTHIVNLNRNYVLISHLTLCRDLSPELGERIDFVFHTFSFNWFSIFILHPQYN